MKIDLYALGERIRGQRINKRLSQAALAERVGVAQSTISRIEAGEAVPWLGLAVDLSDTLGIDLRLMLTGKAKP